MRALLLALVALFHFSGVSWARETIVSGDSDHAYLPTDHQREVMLHRFSFRTDTSIYLAFGENYTTKYDQSAAVHCVQQHAYQPTVAMTNTNRECTKAENSFRAPRPFKLTRVMLVTAATSGFNTSAFAQAAMRIISIQPDGTVAEVGSEQEYASGNGVAKSWSLAERIPAGVGVGLQLRRTSSLVFETVDSRPTVELWGIWE